MDPLTTLLTQRAMGTPSSTPPPLPVVPPSGGNTHTPPEAQRFINAQNLMNAYRSNWTPNPILLQATQAK